MGIKTPKYFKTISMIDDDNQEHHGILVERIYGSIITKQIYLYPYVSMNRVLFHHPVPILDDLKHHQYWQSFVLPK
jgi:hypothetical protein